MTPESVKSRRDSGSAGASPSHTGGSAGASPSHTDGSSVREIPAARGPIHAVVSAPGSKSLTNRALLVTSLAEGESLLTGALFSDDTHYMSRALELAGVGIEQDEVARQFRVKGRGGPPGPVAERVFVGNAGTAMRFLATYFTLGEGQYVLDGVPRMRERPIGDLLESLRSLGADVRAEQGNGCPPVMINACGLEGGKASMPGHRSSQYFSSILLSAPYSRRGVELEVAGSLASGPYLDLTADVMTAFGITLENDGYQRFRVQPGVYQGQEYAIEPDASAASYLFAAAAVTGGVVTVPGLSLGSRQGDIEFPRLLERMGCQVKSSPEGLTLTGSPTLQGLDVDMNGCSDVALTLAAVAPFASTPTHIRNVEHIRIQETDRITAITTELQRAGVQVEERQDGFSVFPSEPRPATFETYDDHRIAMSLAILALRTPGCSVLHPECVNKTFPGYFEVLEGMVGV